MVEVSGERVRGESRYKIGAVERLTGIPASSIRIWERRYQAVVPARADSGTRYYSDQDVERLRLMRELTDTGDAISEVAGLTLEALRARRQEFSSENVPAAGVRRLVFIGTFDADLEGQARMRPGVQDVTCVPDQAALSECAADIVVLQLPTLHRDQSAVLHALRRQTGARLLAVIYRFASDDVCTALASSELRLLRGPRRTGEILDWLFGLPLPAAVDDGLDELLLRSPAPPQFEASQLARIAELDSSVRCECPHHLADLIGGLLAFEQYSAECLSRNEEDARLHARLLHGTAVSREIMEKLLRETLAHEGINL